MTIHWFFLAPDFQELDPWKRNALHLAGKPMGFPIDIPKQAGSFLQAQLGLIPDGSKASKELVGRFSVDYDWLIQSLESVIHSHPKFNL